MGKQLRTVAGGTARFSASDALSLISGDSPVLRNFSSVKSATALVAAAGTGPRADRKRRLASACFLLPIAAFAALVSTERPAEAQAVACNPSFFVPSGQEAVTTCSVSNFHNEVDVTVPGGGVAVPGGGPLQAQLDQVFAGPNGTAVLNVFNALNVVTAGSGVTGKIFVGTTQAITNSVSIGPGTVLIGPDLSLSHFIPLGFTNIDQNTSFESFFELLTASQSLTQRGVNWLSGDLYTTVQTTLLDDGFRFVDMLLARSRDGGALAASSPLGFASFAPDRPAGPAADALAYMATKAPPTATAYVADGWSAWLAGSGTSAKFDGTANNFGFGYRSGGAAGGMERRSGDWFYGAAFAVSRANVNQDSTGDSAGIDTQRLGAYAAWQGPLTISAAISYGHHSTDASRLTMLPGLGAQSGYQANSLNAGLDVSKTYAWRWVNVQPMLGMIYNGLWTDGFVESGNSLLGINSTSANIAALKGYVGGRAYRTFVTSNGVEVTPELRARAVYDFLNDPRGFNATFTADPTATSFAVSGLQPNRTSGIVGTGVTVQFAPRWRAFANYDAEVRGGSIAHIASGGIKVIW
jgi:uncharacterized protein with beta-barrel porin domain